MKYAIGYQLPQRDRERITDVVDRHRPHVAEVYFPWVGTASGRAALGVKRGATDWTAQRVLEQDLARLRGWGVRLDLLLNSNCYGGRAVSEQLQNEVGALLDYLETAGLQPETVTTASLTVARTIKTYFPGVEVRASVNMRIGGPEEMSYVAPLFDSFYLRRDMQRNLTYVRRVKAWCDGQNKGLYLLANSGCLYSCPGQTFHDNLVAHDAEIDEMKNIPDWNPHLCRELYRDPGRRVALLRGTWIRPEDIAPYEGVVDMMKLATRMHDHPERVVQAYATGAYDGNLLDLLEPGYGGAFAPYLIDNRAFPPDWFAKTSACERDCPNCSYCQGVFERVYREAGRTGEGLGA